MANKKTFTKKYPHQSQIHTENGYMTTIKSIRKQNLCKSGFIKMYAMFCTKLYRIPKENMTRDMPSHDTCN